jgi:hypothetical protein
MCGPCPRPSWTGWPHGRGVDSARRAPERMRQHRPHGRDRRSRAAQVAQRAALLGLAGAGRARRLVHARRPRAGRRAVPAGQGQPHPARQAARVHPPQLRSRRRRRLVLPERPAARLRRTRGRTLGVARRARRRRRAGARPHRPPGASTQQPGSTNRGGCFSIPTSVSASCTAWTWATPPTPSRAVPGHRSPWPSSRCRRASASSARPGRRAPENHNAAGRRRSARSRRPQAAFIKVVPPAGDVHQDRAARRRRVSPTSARWRPRRAPWARRACRRTGWPCRPRRGRSRVRNARHRPARPSRPCP